jgi:pentose-5-phosphate-3-epimerase
MEVWAEMPSRGAAPPPADVDGCLVMLIPPGTVLDADPAGVGVVQGLSTSMPVAVDGGVTAELAARCAAAGAEWIVSGRALLTISNHRKESEDVV